MRNPFTIIALMIIAAIIGLLYTFGWTPWAPAAPDEAVVVDEEVRMEASSSVKSGARSSVRSESIQPVRSSVAPAAVIKEEVEVEHIPAPTAASSAPASRAAVSAVSSTPASRPPVNVITLPAKSSSVSSAATEGGLPGEYRTTGD